MTETPPTPKPQTTTTTPAEATAPPAKPKPREVGGPAGPEPTRYGDWERKGRVSDF
jgi:hypothetical protein